jgi:hypothetical protein
MKFPFIAFEDETFKVILDENDETIFKEYPIYRCTVIYNSPKGKYKLCLLVSQESTEESEWYKHVCEITLERFKLEP